MATDTGRGLTAGMHSHTSEAAIKRKILRNPVVRCTTAPPSWSVHQIIVTWWKITEPKVEQNWTFLARRTAMAASLMFPKLDTESLYMDLQCVGRTFSNRNPIQPRKIMCIVVKINRSAIVQRCPIRLLDPGELAFFMDILVSVIPLCMGQGWLSAQSNYPDADTLS